MRPAVEGHDARLVDHLVADRDQARGLHDLVAVVVDDRQDRAGDAARDAAVVEAAIGVGIGRAALLAGRCQRLGACCASAVSGGMRPSGGSTMSDAW